MAETTVERGLLSAKLPTRWVWVVALVGGVGDVGGGGAGAVLSRGRAFGALVADQARADHQQGLVSDHPASGACAAAGVASC